MTRIRLLFTFATLCSVLCLGQGQMAMAQEKKAPNVQDPSEKVKINPNTKHVQDLALADKLITFGREHKNAESLLLAAKIIHTTPTRKLKANKDEVTGDAVKAPAAKQKDNSPKALIAEARAMSSAAHIVAMATATEKILDEETRGPLDGPFRSIRTVGPNQVWTISGNFVGGQLAQADVRLTIIGRFVLTVHDQFGNEVARDAVPGNYYNCRWVPRTTGFYTIRLTNIDNISFSCDMLVN